LEAQEVKTPEQLPLDFSACDDAETGKASPGAVIYRMDLFRHTEDVSLAAVYDAIYDAVKHVSVRRTSTDRPKRDSSFY